MGCTCSAETKENLNPNIPKEHQKESIEKNVPEKISLKKKEEKSFNKEMYKSLASSLPERTNTDLQSLKNIM